MYIFFLWAKKFPITQINAHEVYSSGLKKQNPLSKEKHEQQTNTHTQYDNHILTPDEGKKARFANADVGDWMLLVPLDEQQHREEKDVTFDAFDMGLTTGIGLRTGASRIMESPVKAGTAKNGNA